MNYEIVGSSAMTGPDREEERLLTPQDVASRLRVPITWVYGSCRPRAKNPLPFVKVGHYLRFEEQAVLDYVERNKKRYPQNGER